MNCLQLDPSPVLKLPGRESQETIANLVRPRVLSPARTYRHCQSNRSHRKGREQTLNYSRDSKWKVTWWQRYECHWPLSEQTSITAGTSRQLVTVAGFIIHRRTAQPRSSITDRRSRGRHSIPIFSPESVAEKRKRPRWISRMRPGHSLKLRFPLGISAARFFSNWLSARAGRSVLRACDSKANFISAARIDNLVW